MQGGGIRGGPAGPSQPEEASLLALKEELLRKQAKLSQLLKNKNGAASSTIVTKEEAEMRAQRLPPGYAYVPQGAPPPNSAISPAAAGANNGGISDAAFDVLDEFLEPTPHPMPPGSPTPGSLPRTNTVPFSFDPEDDPVVCRMAARAAAAVGGGGGAMVASTSQEELQQQQQKAAAAARAAAEALEAQRQQDREQRLSAKRKYSELECSIERLAVRVVQSAGARDDLQHAADAAEAAAEDAEMRRRTMQAGRSVRESAPGRQRGGPPPFDASAFAAVAAKRKLEIVNKQCLVSLRQLMQHKWAFPFLKPVDAAALGLPTYHDVVKTPMDLGSVEAGIKKGGVYWSCEEVHRDVSLTFANAKLFNPAATDVHVMAATLEQFWAPRWEAICERVREVEEGMNVEKEAAEKKSAEMSARQALAAEEMKCAGLMADLDQLKRSLEDLKRTSVRITKPMTERERTRLARRMSKLPRGYRGAARDMIAETEGAHNVPEGALRDDEDAWRGMCDDLNDFGAVAHRRLARFAKVRRRNATAVGSGWCAPPPPAVTGGGDDAGANAGGGGEGGDDAMDVGGGVEGGESGKAAAGEGQQQGAYGVGEDFDFGDETESEDEDEEKAKEEQRRREQEQQQQEKGQRLREQRTAAAEAAAAVRGGVPPGDGATLLATPGGFHHNGVGVGVGGVSQQQHLQQLKHQQHLDSVEATLAAAAAAAAAAVTAAENGTAVVKGRGSGGLHDDGDDEEDPLLALAMGGGAHWGAMGAGAAQPELAEVIARESGGYFLDRSVSRDSPPGVGATAELGGDFSGSVLHGPEGGAQQQQVAAGGKGGSVLGGGMSGVGGGGGGDDGVDLVEDLLLAAPTGGIVANGDAMLL